MRRVTQSVTRFLKSRHFMIAGMFGLDAYWQHKERPDDSWTGVLGRVGLQWLFWDVIMGKAALPVAAAIILPSLASTAADYYNARRVERYYTMGAPNLGGMYTNFQMSPTAFQMQSQGLSQIRESRRFVGATMGSEAAYYARRRR